MNEIKDRESPPPAQAGISRVQFLGYSSALLATAALTPARGHSTLPADNNVKSSPGKTRSPQVQKYRNNGKLSDRIPDVQLLTHEGRPVHFYQDLVKNRTVIIDFMWASCDDDCPIKTVNLSRVHRGLGPRVGRDLLMLSISLEGRQDTPASLRNYIERYGGNRAGWIYLTGEYEDVEALRYSLGVYDLDPVLDADRSSHAGIVTFGNDSTNRWAALPVLMDSRGIVRTISRITRDKG